MEGARCVCAHANFLCSVSIPRHQLLHIGWGAAAFKNFPLKSCILRRHIHHSAELQRFYTNRLYKKRCTSCGRPNIIPVTRCGYCDKQLTDRDIHPIERDVLREVAASRTYLYRRGALLRECADVQMPVTPGFSVGSSCIENICREPGFLHSHQASSLMKKPDYLYCIEEYYRSFDFLIIRYPFPIATVHLSAVMKGTAYDVKQLRPSHVPLLQRMQRQTVAVVEDILQASLCLQEDGQLMRRRLTCTDSSDERAHRGNVTREEGSRVADEGLRKSALSDDFISSVSSFRSVNKEHLFPRKGTKRPQRVLTGETSTSSSSKQPLKKTVETMKSCIIFGFTYPCEYNQVNMHAIVPPIFNFNMLRAPFFLPLKRVLHDLQESGSVQVNVHQAGNVT